MLRHRQDNGIDDNIIRVWKDKCAFMNGISFPVENQVQVSLRSELFLCKVLFFKTDAMLGVDIIKF